MDDGALIEQVSVFPQLYVKTDPRYKNLRLKENAWKTIAAILEETPEACEHRWKTLRNKYTTLKRELNYIPSGSGASEVTWPYFESMRFLDPFLLTRKSYSNLSLKRKPENKEWDSISTILDESQEFEKENSPERTVQEGPSTSFHNPKQKSTFIHSKTVLSSKNVENETSRNMRTLETNIPRHTVPFKKQKTELLTDKLTGCFETFQKVLENNQHPQQQPDSDEFFVRSLAQDLKVFSHKKKILIKREIYNVIANHLESEDSE